MQLEYSNLVLPEPQTLTAARSSRLAGFCRILALRSLYARKNEMSSLLAEKIYAAGNGGFSQARDGMGAFEIVAFPGSPIKKECLQIPVIR